MTTRSARVLLLRAVDLTPWAVGSTLLWLGLQGNPAFSLAGSLILSVAGLQLFASANGYSTPRPGRVRIAAQTCGDPPLAFFVRQQRRGLLFRLAEPREDVPDRYCVVAVPVDRTESVSKSSSFEAPEDSRLVGTVQADQLRFDFQGGSYVDRACLRAVLRRLGV